MSSWHIVYLSSCHVPSRHHQKNHYQAFLGVRSCLDHNCFGIGFLQCCRCLGWLECRGRSHAFQTLCSTFALRLMCFWGIGCFELKSLLFVKSNLCFYEVELGCHEFLFELLLWLGFEIKYLFIFRLK